MVIGKFKSNNPLIIPYLLLIAIAMWLDGFIYWRNVVLPIENAAPVYSLIAPFFNTYKLASVILSFIFMALQAFILNKVIADRNLVSRNSWLPALFYIVLMSSSFGLFGLQPIWFANFFLILSLDKMFDVFKGESANIEIFNIGLFISIASLFYFPALIFILLLLSALMILYLVTVREILASLTGLIIPWLFIFTIYYWFDLLGNRVEYLAALRIHQGSLTLQIDTFGWITIIITGLIGVIALAKIYLGTIREHPIRIRKRFQVLLAYLILATVALLLSGTHITIHHGIIILPLSVIMAAFFQENKRALLNEILFTILILLAIIGKIAGHLQ